MISLCKLALHGGGVAELGGEGGGNDFGFHLLKPRLLFGQI